MKIRPNHILSFLKRPSSVKPFLSTFAVLLALAQPAFAAGPRADVPQRTYVNSLADFRDHIVSHIERTTKIGEALRRRYPKYFAGVDPNLLRAFLGRHDLKKLDPKILKRLYKAYNNEFKSVTGEMIPGMQKHFVVMRVVNRGDDRHALDFFRAFNKNNRFMSPDGKYTRLAKLYLLIEMIADKVDRGLSPVSAEEFNREHMETASSYFRKNPGLFTPLQTKLAEYLESAVPENERMEFFRKRVARGKSLEQLKREYPVVRVYDVAIEGSSFEDYRARKSRLSSSVRVCLLNQVMKATLERGDLMVISLPLGH